MEGIWPIAFGLVLLIEGIIPLLLPKQWRETMARLMRFSDGQLRFCGLIAVLSGLAVLWFVRAFS